MQSAFMGRTANVVENIRLNPTVEASVALPPVIVLNLFHSGLGIARQLVGKGVRVLGLSAHPRIYGNFTRLCGVRAAPDSQEHPREMADFLLRLSSDLGGAIIFPTRDADVLFLDRFRADLEPFYSLAIPPRHVLFHIIDKAALAKTAMEAGIPVPRTTLVANRAQLQPGAEKVRLPCVVKPVSSVHWRQGNNWKIVGGRKAFRVDSLFELQQAYDRISQVRSEILLQEWIPGGADQILVWGGYVRYGLEPLAFFTARKVVQAPDEFGTGCVVETDRIPDLIEPSVRLCRALGYEGIAEIEYKRDVRDGTLKLIEINARHWDWHQLGSSSGVNLTWAAYCHLTHRPIAPMHPNNDRAKWVAEDTFLTYALANFCGGELSPLQIWNALAGRRIYGVFAWNDPLPFLRYSLATLFPTLVGAAVRKIRRSAFDGGQD
jgi:D-aspartate ligase